MSDTDMGHAGARLRPKSVHTGTRRSQPRLRNQMPYAAVPVQCVPEAWILAFDFAVQLSAVHNSVLTWRTVPGLGMMLQICYALRDTNVVYATTRRKKGCSPRSVLYVATDSTVPPMPLRISAKLLRICF
eukprot:1517779-Rhodomonas_salina.2